MNIEKIRIAVCVCTYKRPRELERLLLSLGRLVFVKNAAPQIKIIVVDNEPCPRVKELCNAMQNRIPWEVQYEKESAPGISHARNKALEAAEKGADFLAFIDDDEEPDFRWLDELLFVQKIHQADIVTGPVIRKPEKPIPSWWIRGGLLQGDRFANGMSCKTAYTGNVLMCTSILKKINFRFNHKHAFSGGEDYIFFSKLAMQGFRILWADEAIIYEWIPQERTSLLGLCRRFFWLGNIYVFCQRDLWGAVPAFIKGSFFGFRCATSGIIHIFLSPFGRSVFLVKGIKGLVKALGVLAALFNIRFCAYKRSTGK